MRALPLLAVALLTLESCATRPVVLPAPPAPRPITPVPPPPVAPAPAPAPVPVPPPLSGDWQDWPFSAGGWSWRAETNGSAALFGQAESARGVDGPDRAAVLKIQCDLPRRRLTLSRVGRANETAPMTIRTDFGPLSWPVTNVVDARGDFWATTTRSAGDMGWDQIAYSRGRFTVELPGMAPLVLRPWAEISRVIEDCRQP